jgi:hypothetical protein
MTCIRQMESISPLIRCEGREGFRAGLPDTRPGSAEHNEEQYPHTAKGEMTLPGTPYPDDHLIDPVGRDTSSLHQPRFHTHR